METLMIIDKRNLIINIAREDYIVTGTDSFGMYYLEGLSSANLGDCRKLSRNELKHYGGDVREIHRTLEMLCNAECGRHWYNRAYDEFIGDYMYDMLSEDEKSHYFEKVEFIVREA